MRPSRIEQRVSRAYGYDADGGEVEGDRVVRSETVFVVPPGVEPTFLVGRRARPVWCWEQPSPTADDTDPAGYWDQAVTVLVKGHLLKIVAIDRWPVHVPQPAFWLEEPPAPRGCHKAPE